MPKLYNAPINQNKKLAKTTIITNSNEPKLILQYS